MRENRIKELRVTKRMTQEELAKEVGITAAAVSRHENHQREPDEQTAARYTKALGASCWKRS